VAPGPLRSCVVRFVVGVLLVCFSDVFCPVVVFVVFAAVFVAFWTLLLALLLSDYRCSSLEELTPFFLSRLTTQGLRPIFSAVPLSLRALPFPGCFPGLVFPSSWLPLLCVLVFSLIFVHAV
jgi:hypothetical protein